MLDEVGDRATCRDRLEIGDLEQAALYFGLVTVPVLLFLLRQSLEERLGDEVLDSDRPAAERTNTSVHRLRTRRSKEHSRFPSVPVKDETLGQVWREGYFTAE